MLGEQMGWFWNIRRLSNTEIGMLADDIAMEVCTALHMKFKANTVQDIKYPKAFIWRMVLHKAIDEDRRLGRFNRLEYSEKDYEPSTNDLSIPLDFIRTDDTGESMVIKDVEQKLVRKVLRELKPYERYLICLRYYEELSYKEISEIIGETPNYVGVIFYNLRKKIGSMLDKVM